MVSSECITFLKSSDMLGIRPSDVLRLQSELSEQWQRSRYRNANDVWWVDGIPTDTESTYDSTFYPLLQKMGFSSIGDMLKKRKTQGSGNHVLDIMGGCYFLENPHDAETLTGFRKSNIDFELMDKYESEHFPGDMRVSKLEELLDMVDEGKRTIVTGDVFNLEDWDRLKLTSTRTHNTSGFDIIFLRPEGPFMGNRSEIGRDENDIKINTRTKLLYRDAYFNLFSNAVAMMSSERSVLFAQFPRAISDDLDVFQERVNDIFGFTCITYGGERYTSGGTPVPTFVVSIIKE